MSYSRCLSLSALLASTFITPVTAMDLTPVSSDNNAILEYTHTYTPIPEPASSFADISRSYQTAGICFLGVGDCDPNVGFASSGSSSGGNDDYTVNTTNQCLNEGFSKQNCNSVQTIDGVCPYNSAYGLGCKCASNLVSCPAGQVGVGESCNGQYASCQCDPALLACSSKEVGQGASCGGRYESCVCKDMYLYNSSNCSYPRSVSGDSCGGQYTDCVCPTGVDEGQYGCAEYYPSPCSSVCKVAYSDNCHIRSDDPNIALGYGCMKYYDDCSSKCERAYTDMCRERTAVSTPYGCESYYSDCSSKCQTAYADNCRNRTAVIGSCPSNASCSYYSDCSSKISSWSCNSGYKQEGSSCVADGCKIGYIYYTDGKCLPSANHQTNKTVLGIVVHTTDNGKHGQIMAPWLIDANGNKSSSGVGMAWGGSSTDISSLPNYTTSSSASTDYDSCGNTDKIVAAGNANTYPAAWAARKYAPTSTTNGKWCLPAVGILRNIQGNQSAISTAVSKVGGASNQLNYWVWSSSENNSTGAWYVHLAGSSLIPGGKSNPNYYVLPVLEF